MRPVNSHGSNGGRYTFGVLLVVTFLVFPAAPSAAQSPRPTGMAQPPSTVERVPESLSASDWSAIRAAFEANRRIARDDESGDRAVWDNGSGAHDVRDAHAAIGGDSLVQQAYLKASNTDAGDHFGWSVAVSGNTVLVGARWEDSNATGVNGNQADNSAPSSGAAFVFIRDMGGNWSQQAYLKASNTDAGDLFGYSVAVSGDTVVVGAHNEDSNATGVNGGQADDSALNSGAAYVFVRDRGRGLEPAGLPEGL